MTKNFTGKELEEIQELKRKGATSIEIWKFVLNSPHHKKAWENSSNSTRLELIMWEFINTFAKNTLDKFEQKSSSTKRMLKNSTIHWVEIVKNAPVEIRFLAIQLLQKNLKEAQQDIPALLQLFPTQDGGVTSALRSQMVNIFFELENQKNSTLIPQLMKSLEKSNNTIKRRVLILLGLLQNSASLAIPVVFSFLTHKNEKLSLQAGQTLYRISPGNETIVPGLVPFLHHHSIEIQLRAIAELEKIGELAYACTPDLIKLLKSKNAEVVEKTIRLLSEIGPKAAAASPFLLETLQSKNRYHRVYSARALGRIGKTSPLVAELLIKALQTDAQPSVRRGAAEALGRIKEENAIPALIGALKDKSYLVRYWSIDALGNIGEPAKTAISKIEQFFTKGSLEERSMANNAILRINSKKTKRAKLK